MAYEVDSQSPHIRALTETIAVPPYIPVTSPSAKRKRDVLLYITPISANSSFNSVSTTTTGSASASFGSDGVCEGCEGVKNGPTVNGGVIGALDGTISTGGAAGGGCSCEDMKTRGNAAGVDKSSGEEVEAPSPRTRVANKLEGLNLGNGTAKEDAKDTEPSSKSAMVLKSWRKSGVGKFTDFDDVKHANGTTIIDTETQSNQEDDDAELNRTPKKKRSTKPPSGRDSRSKDADVAPKKRKGKAKPTFQEPREVEMTTVNSAPADLEPSHPDNDSESPTASSSSNEPFAFVGVTKQTKSSGGRLRSPPPSIPEDEAQRLEEEEDTDSDPDQTGIGYRPTAQQRDLRNQKRMQQIKEYKARESREARAKRTAERRRRNVTERGASATSSTSSLLIATNPEDDEEMVDVQKSLPSKRVHFEL
ncbi:hypothetical protein Dda_0820 [Drechslerella dactyloides]|uniref:Uncharacterized protein n=1 Tax=Drechslerella dactyloides TaxID=74499 RepID=A0AAD6NMD8_DREDA|nr:hypothetical protein Dda_0820 [Drechslerella dactyloides]